MQIKLLSDIIVEIAGKEASELINILFGKKDINEFLVAKKLKLTINQTRNIFYKLSNLGLVSFTRKKDKRKGWYTYFWTLNNAKALELLENKLQKEIENLRQQLKSRETKRFYVCKTCNTEVSEETALIHNFTCKECGQVYVLNDDKKVFIELEKNIAKLERQRNEVLPELGKIRQDERKKMDKKDRRESKKKEKERRLKREKKKKEKKKMQKKGSKKKKKINKKKKKKK